MDPDEHMALIIEAMSERADELGIGPREDSAPRERGLRANRVSRWLKVLSAGLVVLIALLVLNAIAVTNKTKDAERNVEGARAGRAPRAATLQVVDEGDPEGSPIVLLHGATRVDALVRGAGRRCWAEDTA